MQQWFEQDQTSAKNSSDIKFHSVPKSSNEMEKSILKTFTVEAETITGQYICVSGNCSTLGDWEVNKAFVLSNTNVIRIRKNRKYCIWTGSVHLPPEKEIFFRYFMAYIVEPDGEFVTQKHIFVHSWESQPEPRRVQNETQISTSDYALQSDMYGMNDKNKISKGFLTTECAIQFKLFDTPITFWKSNLQSKMNLVSVKMTPVPLSSKLSADSGDSSPNISNVILEDSSSHGTDYIQKQFGWPYVEYVDIPGGYSFKHQNQFGTIMQENIFHLFQTKMYNFSCVGYLFDFYLHKESSEEPPYHIGFTHILPSNMKYSNGIIISPITSVRHRPIGELKIDYLIIKPTKDIKCTLEHLRLTDWKNSHFPLDIGHRGSGSSFKQILSDCSHIRENTIASLKEAANKGADLVEFDVQLTKDLVPIINHDFVVSMATKSKTNVLAEEVEMVQIPLKDFSFEQLQKLKIYHVKEPYTLSKTHFLNDIRNDYQPFPKLEKAFTDVDINVGFNIELKWTMKLQDGTYELDNPFDMNLFVDTILKTTFEFAGSRSIVFSCFHPDVCTMLKMKQNRYPILFLTQGVTVRYPTYADPRCHSIQNAVYHATCHDLLGVNVHSEDLLRDPLQINIVKQAGLALFCWGDDNNCKDVVNKFKKLGVNAVIYDKLDKIELLKKKMSCSTESPDVFIANNYCDQNDILLSKQQSLNEDPHLREDNEKDNNRYFMDVGKASFQNQCSSTETLWNEKKSDSKMPSKKQRFDCVDGLLESDVKPTKSKKSKTNK
ncbi:glycerophosphocholine phosphodiesterase GPCPD1-like isoform X1 [Melanaphis sacchari]|uniref:Glycerophosphocholine phosphodiesterase GPCPD1 n=2 Tax=Melanaphis sacchari TaxID=742174 RepID=A0A2H8TZ22_9HEMI|nr:glycerophosphocholine phosphodiesterase GPCPD1-like isoform X1 [Melanaphis sacchari]XP_025192313.1 glycerophosphocholine phosphodiesterase GPCPD1-like isoform X1 [Melanaphis sacchari]